MHPSAKDTVLEIIKYDSYFRFSLKDDPNVSWVVKPDPDSPDAFMLMKEVDGRVHGLKKFEYNTLNVGNICKMFLMLIINPNKYFELLTGQKAVISKVELINMSKVIEGGFTSCVFGVDLSPR
jgi:hypothetical protein